MFSFLFFKLSFFVFSLSALGFDNNIDFEERRKEIENQLIEDFNKKGELGDFDLSPSDKYSSLKKCWDSGDKTNNDCCDLLKRYIFSLSKKLAEKELRPRFNGDGISINRHGNPRNDDGRRSRHYNPFPFRKSEGRELHYIAAGEQCDEDSISYQKRMKDFIKVLTCLGLDQELNEESKQELLEYAELSDLLKRRAGLYEKYNEILIFVRQ